MNQKEEKVNYQMKVIVGVNNDGSAFDLSDGLIEHIFDTQIDISTKSEIPAVIDLVFSNKKNSLIVTLPFISPAYGTDVTKGGKLMSAKEQDKVDYLIAGGTRKSAKTKPFDDFAKSRNDPSAVNESEIYFDMNLSVEENDEKLFKVIDLNSQAYMNYVCHELAKKYMIAVSKNNMKLAKFIQNINIMKQFDLNNFSSISKLNLNHGHSTEMSLVKWGDKTYAFGLQPADPNDKNFLKKFSDINYANFARIVEQSLKAIQKYSENSTGGLNL